MLSSIPENWSIYQDNYNKGSLYDFQKTFSDGIDVVISIYQKNKEYEVWVSVEHRVSGPNEKLISKENNIEDAVSAAKKQIDFWEEELEE